MKGDSLTRDPSDPNDGGESVDKRAPSPRSDSRIPSVPRATTPPPARPLRDSSPPLVVRGGDSRPVRATTPPPARPPEPAPRATPLPPSLRPRTGNTVPPVRATSAPPARDTPPPARATSTPPPPRRSGPIPVQPPPAATPPPRDVDSAIRRIEADTSRPIVDTPRSGSSFAGDTSPGAPSLRNDDSGIRADELPFFDDDLAEPPTAQLTSAALDPQARAVIATCESELETKPDAVRAARLQYEIARAYELAIGFSEQAAEHYRLALDSSPEYLPAIQGSRRTEIARGNFDAALAL